MFRGFVPAWAVVLLLALCPIAHAAPSPVAHFYSLNDTASWDSLRQNAPHIQLLSPAWFTLDESLALQSVVDPAVVAWAKEARVPLMPLVSNFKFDAQIAHALLVDNERQEKLTAELADGCLQHGFRGMQLDFENVLPADRDAFTGFVRRLAHAFHDRHLALSLALPAPLEPNPQTHGQSSSSWRPNDHAAGFDYRALGKLADFVSVMTYDQHVTEPGPIAGMPWVEACVRAMVGLVPHGKLMLGVALYHRHWSRPTQPATAKYTVTDGPYTEAVQLAAQRNVRLETDTAEHEQTFSYTDGENNHVVWLGGSDVLEQRLRLVKQYRLRGFSAWRLGQEDPTAWRRTLARQHKR